MYAPEILPEPSKCTVTSLPKRDELSLRSVFALPKASSTGLECTSSSCSETWPSVAATAASSPCVPATAARKRKTCFEFSVLPEPDSPEVTSACDWPCMHSALYASAVSEKMCGGSLSVEKAA